MQADRSTELRQLLAERILILDGAMGTMIQQEKLGEADYRGDRFIDHPKDLKGNNDLLVLTRPDVVAGIHRAYLEAGADIIETNTFNATRVSQAEYGLEALAYELNVEGARLVRELCDEYTAKNPAKPRYCAGVLGPTSRTLSISPDVNDPGFRNISFDALADDYYDSAKALLEGGADILLIETVFDTLNAKAAVFAIEKLFDDLGKRWPEMISGTITDASGRTLSGQTAEAFWNSLSHAQPISFGLNCALGADQLRQYVEELSNACDTHVSAHPNAGLPNPLSPTGYDETPGAPRGPDPRVGAERPGEHRRRLLRHHAGAYRGARRSCPGLGAACRADHRQEAAPVRPRALQRRQRRPVRQRRRTHQRHRLQGLRTHDPRGPLRRRARGGAPAGRERRPGHRHQHGRGDAGLGRRHGPLLQAHRHRAGHLARRSCSIRRSGR